MFHYAKPPTLLDNVIDDLDEVTRLFERNAPYTPLGGWFMRTGFRIRRRRSGRCPAWHTAARLIDHDGLRDEACAV